MLGESVCIDLLLEHVCGFTISNEQQVGCWLSLNDGPRGIDQVSVSLLWLKCGHGDQQLGVFIKSQLAAHMLTINLLIKLFNVHSVADRRDLILLDVHLANQGQLGFG